MLKTRVRLGWTDVSLSHPFFWAAFVLVGGGRQRDDDKGRVVEALVVGTIRELSPQDQDEDV